MVFSFTPGQCCSLHFWSSLPICRSNQTPSSHKPYPCSGVDENWIMSCFFITCFMFYFVDYGLLWRGFTFHFLSLSFSFSPGFSWSVVTCILKPEVSHIRASCVSRLPTLVPRGSLVCSWFLPFCRLRFYLDLCLIFRSLHANKAQLNLLQHFCFSSLTWTWSFSKEERWDLL